MPVAHRHRRRVSSRKTSAEFSLRGTAKVRGFAAEGKRVITLDDTGCLCTTMYRISPQHLAWVLENLVEGRVVNRIQVKPSVKHWARVALDRMLEAGS